MTIVALGKQVFTILYIESLKSIVTSLTFSRSSLGIFSRIALTVSAFVPFTEAISVFFMPWPALLVRNTYTSPQI